MIEKYIYEAQKTTPKTDPKAAIELAGGGVCRLLATYLYVHDGSCAKLSSPSIKTGVSAPF